MVLLRRVRFAYRNTAASVQVVGGGIAVTTYVEPHPVNIQVYASAIILAFVRGYGQSLHTEGSIICKGGKPCNMVEKFKLLGAKTIEDQGS